MEKIALVTGSTNNIGKAVAEVLARKGYHRKDLFLVGKMFHQVISRVYEYYRVDDL